MPLASPDEIKQDKLPTRRTAWLLHGSPSLGSDHIEPLEAMANQGTTVIRLDQLGCGRPDRSPHSVALNDIKLPVSRLSPCP